MLSFGTPVCSRVLPGSAERSLPAGKSLVSRLRPGGHLLLDDKTLGNEAINEPRDIQTNSNAELDVSKMVKSSNAATGEIQLPTSTVFGLSELNDELGLKLDHDSFTDEKSNPSTSEIPVVKIQKPIVASRKQKDFMKKTKSPMLSTHVSRRKRDDSDTFVQGLCLGLCFTDCQVFDDFNMEYCVNSCMSFESIDDFAMNSYAYCNET